MGSENVSIKVQKEGSEEEELSLGDVQKLSTLLIKIHEFMRSVQFNGNISPDMFLKEFNEKGMPPRFVISAPPSKIFLYDAEHVISWLESQDVEIGQKIVNFLDGKISSITLPNGSRASILFVQDQYLELQRLLTYFNLNLQDYLDSGEKLFTCILSAGDKIYCKSLSSLFSAIKDTGKKGLSVYHNKGLGEMDYEDLRTTGMDPRTRRLLQIIMQDVHEADEMIKLLMGDAVIPRREFIENHALLVIQLDI